MHGPLALVGSGEYTDAMNETDLAMLSALPAGARVAVIPTASGLEPAMPETWNARGVAHFSALGARVTPLLITERAHCADAGFLRALGEADFIYFSGGNPGYAIGCWRDTPAWEAVLTRWRAGAALAGCSAGAMMLGACTIRARVALSGRPIQWTPALGAAGGVAVIPHFDRMRRFAPLGVLDRVFASAPRDVTVAGIDEDTAAVQIAGEWRVMGRQGVTLFRDGGSARYERGDQLPLT